MKVIVVGGGPAGLMAAGTASRTGADVTLLEKNEKVGKKLYITGKGRCNITNTCENSPFLDNIIHNSKFLLSAEKKFDYSSVIEFFDEYGLETKVERGGRVFPVSDKASDVTKALLKFCSNVRIQLNTKVNGIEIKDGKVAAVNTDKGFFSCDKAIIATGGISYPLTGSTGDGYNIAKKLGHNIVKPKPALVPILITESKDIYSLQGVSLKNVSVTAVLSNGKSITEFGEMLFTDRGVTGPLILTLSSKINESVVKYLSLNLKPALTREVLDKRLLREFEQNKNRDFKNSLGELLPNSLIELVISRSEIGADTKVNQITVAGRTKLIDTLQDLRLYGVKLADVAVGIVTAGGINVNEVNPKTMESKIVSGLYFAGEVLDVDGLTGGYNIHIALATGNAAGSAAGGDNA